MGGKAMRVLAIAGAKRPENGEPLTERSLQGRLCMIGGFDQFHFLKDCPPELTRAEVRRCFEEAGTGGGYILCTSDNYFDADPELLKAFADEARHCTY